MEKGVFGCFFGVRVSQVCYVVFMSARKQASKASKGKMGAKGKSGEAWPRRVRYEGAEVVMTLRGDGRISLRWREEGSWKRTTKGDLDVALGFAERKARELAGKMGMQWIRPGDAEGVEALRRLAVRASMSLGDVVSEVRAAAEVLGGVRKLRAAAEYYAGSGPGSVAEIRLHEALALVRAEYDFSRGATRNTMHVAIDHMTRTMDDVPLAEVSKDEVEKFVFEKGKSVRTVRNRLSQAATFFGRCKALGFWPEVRPLPTVAIKRPRLPDKAPEIFLPHQGEKLLAAVRKECPRYLSYLIIAGWLGCRPSECMKLRWEDFDFPHGVLHLCTETVGKTSRERWIEMPKSVAKALKGIMEKIEDVEGLDRVCLTHAREEISKLARGMEMKWPADVLRHSAITYELQRSGNDYNKTAEKMGNSPKVIEKNYRRPIPAGLAEKWLGLLE